MLFVHKACFLTWLNLGFSALNNGRVSWFVEVIVLSFPDVGLSSWARLAGRFQLCNVGEFQCCV